MRIHVMSDIHFEHMQHWNVNDFYRRLEDSLKEDSEVRVLVLAGDICQIGQHELQWHARLARLCGYYHRVLYVTGNHEYYRSSFHEVDRFLEDIDQSPNFTNFIQLAHGPYAYGGQRFIGDTMWFPDRQADGLTKQMMNDFYVIGDAASPFEPEVYQRHENFRQRVLHKTQAGDIVVTHHLPLRASIDKMYEGSKINQFFCADIESQLDAGALPQLWIHGHTHLPFDYTYKLGQAEMRVYCNPAGYPHEGANDRFWSRLAVDIPDPA